MQPSLRPKQIAALAYYIADKKVMDLSDPGCGKTPPVCVNQLRRFQDGLSTQWVMPKSLLKKNKREIIRFTGVDPDQVVIYDGTAAQLKKLADRKEVVTWLMTPERFKRSWKTLPEASHQALDVDEFHKCFGPGGLDPTGQAATPARTLAFYEFMRHAQECVFMTGTLIHGRLDTCFPAIHAIEPRYYAGYRAFLNHHAWLDSYGRAFAYKNHDRIAQILSRHAIRYTFEEVYGPESKIVIGETAEMSPKQRQVYEEFQKSLTIDLGEAMLDGTAPAATLMLGRQIMETPYSMRDPRGPEFPRVDLMNGENTGKEDLLENHFADHARTGKPLVIFAAFVLQHERIKELAAKFGIEMRVMNGSTSAKQRDDIDVEFQAGRLQGIVCSPEVAAFGFNWQDWGDQGQEVEHFIFVSMDYLDTNFLQAYRRGVRGKRKTPLRITVLKFANSMDDRVFDIIAKKSADANKVDESREVYRFNDLTNSLEAV